MLKLISLRSWLQPGVNIGYKGQIRGRTVHCITNEKKGQWQWVQSGYHDQAVSSSSVAAWSWSWLLSFQVSSSDTRQGLQWTIITTLKAGNYSSSCSFLGYDDACVLDLTSSDRAEKRWYGPPVPPKVFHHHNDHQHDIDHTHQHIQEHSHKVSFIKTV